jgi:Ca2+-transporting ATPase
LTLSGSPTEEKITERELDKPIFVIPFSSARKRATLAMWVEGGTKVRVFCKGAPEIVIEMCTQYIGAGGAVLDLEDEKKEYAIHTIVT